VLLAGRKHPKLMGQSYREAWVEIWDDVKDVFAGAQLTGQATMKVCAHRLFSMKILIRPRMTIVSFSNDMIS
jgi:hypothetical protein